MLAIGRERRSGIRDTLNCFPELLNHVTNPLTYINAFASKLRITSEEGVWNNYIVEYQASQKFFDRNIDRLRKAFGSPDYECLMRSDKFEIFLVLIDQFLSSAAFHLAITEFRDEGNPETLSTVLKKVLPSGFYERYQQLFKAMFINKNPQEVYENPDPQYVQKELEVFEVLVRNVASYAMWLSVFESLRNTEISSYKRAMVSAAAVSFDGTILTLASRGEVGYHTSLHAEDILLKKLKNEGVDTTQVIVGVNLEPCRTRSTKHQLALGYPVQGCSEQLATAHVAAIGYVLPDTNPKQNGKGIATLHRRGILTYQSNHSQAINLASSVQRLEHLVGQLPAVSGA